MEQSIDNEFWAFGLWRSFGSIGFIVCHRWSIFDPWSASDLYSLGAFIGRFMIGKKLFLAFPEYGSHFPIHIPGK